MTPDEKRQFDELHAQVEVLTRTVNHWRGVADTHRRRAELADASAQRAWQLASWGGRRGATVRGDLSIRREESDDRPH
jgi:hypothetical protein